MQCRKRLNNNQRCNFNPDPEETHGYCRYHWGRYNAGLDKYEPENDFHSGFDLNRLANDKQNVHTTIVVNQTLNVIKKLLKESETANGDVLVEIMNECSLSQKACDEMINRYFSNDSIYDLGPNTYKKVLDGLWIKIKQKEYQIRKELYGRLSQELEDNVGTCSQGNISRLANVLNGYGEYIEPPKTLPDIMAEISKDSNVKTRLIKTIKILRERGIEGPEFDSWIEAMLEI